MNLKLWIPLCFSLCVLLLAGCRQKPTADNAVSPTPVLPVGLGIYLVGEDLRTADAIPLELDALPLEETPLISSADIAWYDAHTHEMELTDEAYRRIRHLFPRPVRVDGIPFVVMAGGERVYFGAFWTPLSSLSFDGVVILEPLVEEERLLRIQLGYPGPDFFTGDDPRADPRILDALQADGKLKN